MGHQDNSFNHIKANLLYPIPDAIKVANSITRFLPFWEVILSADVHHKLQQTNSTSKYLNENPKVAEQPDKPNLALLFVHTHSR